MTIGSKKHVKILEPVPPEEEIVISGIAGRFPNSNNMKHFEENLMNKVDLISDDDRRWSLNHPEIPQNTGKVYNLEKFDAKFFDVHYKRAHTMDPMARLLMEHTYEAIIDAGINPKSLRGTKMGVFVGACFSESEKVWLEDKFHIEGSGITGCSRAMLANRISHWLGVTGPSYAVDTACSSSLYAVENAYKSIRAGLCDSAIVGGCNLCLHPYTSLHFYRLGVLSFDGRCKSFDEAANGYGRSESIVAIILQKSKDAKRIYSTLLHAKTNCDGYKENGITFPSSAMQSALLTEFYEEIGIPPSSLDYLEAHATGTKVGDPEEVSTLDHVFCSGRTEPLNIGSIKSNLGHSEPASALCSIAKVIIAMESGLIPPNLHYKTPRKGIKALEEGRFKVVTEPTSWDGGLVGINSFGFGGANAHVLLRSNQKEKINGGLPVDEIPRLVAISGRTESAVNKILDYIESKPADVEFIRLFHDIHEDEIFGHLYRGFTILPPRGLMLNKNREVTQHSEVKRPVCFVFSGIGSQWPGMGEALLQFPIFSEAIKKCEAALETHGIKILEILTSKNEQIFDSIINSFVGIIAIQIGLIELLRNVGIEPDFIMGHGIGEFGCAYTDKCLTIEQTILSAYLQALVFWITTVVRGSTVTVELDPKTLRDLCPSDVEIVGHNASNSTIICGPEETLKSLINKLKNDNVQVTEITCNKVPLHSQYVKEAKPKLLAYLQKIIPNAKRRSDKWISTSVSLRNQNTTAALFSSAEYHTNNILNPIFFEEALVRIPKNAVVIEISPRAVLQQILEQSLAPTVSNITLIDQSHNDNVNTFLQGVGKMFNAGLHPQISKLYPDITYPVSRTTPMISPLIEWDHSEDWYVISYNKPDNITSGQRIIEVKLDDTHFEYIKGHIIDGRVLFPAMGYISLVWETISLLQGQFFTEVPVVFKDVKFLRATTLSKERSVRFSVMIQKGSGRFEISEGQAVVVTGCVFSTDDVDESVKNFEKNGDINEKEIILNTRDIYKELKLRGYQYKDVFRSLKNATMDGTQSTITWKNNWVAFMDNMLQVQIIGTDTRGLFVPTGMEKLVINPKRHRKELQFIDNETAEYPVYASKTLNLIKAGGIEMRGLKINAISRRRSAGEPILEEYKFIEYMDRAETSLRNIVRVSTQIALEHHKSIRVKTLELVKDSNNIDVERLMSPIIIESLSNLPLIQPDATIIGNNVTFDDGLIPSTIKVMDLKNHNGDKDVLLVLGIELLNPDYMDNLNLLFTYVKDGGFVLSCENAQQTYDFAKLSQSRGLNIVMIKKNENHLYVLMRKSIKKLGKSLIINVSNNNFDWIDEMKQTMTAKLKNKDHEFGRIIFVSQGNSESGLVGFINCLRKESGGEYVRGVLIQDNSAPKFTLQNPFYANELDKDLAMSVLGVNGNWGTYRHLPISSEISKLVRQIYANQTIRGDLSSLKWLEGPLRFGFDHENLVYVVYSSINFRDVMLATGKLALEVVAKTRQAQECVFGLEYCGKNASGRRVMGVMENRGMTNLGIADPSLAWDIPDDWSFEDAATVPCAYATCYYALYIVGKMKKGDKVLIHSGSGGVGQAAINLALFEGCEVYTTVGTPEKHRFIRENFHQIAEDHIGNSRTTSFEQLIMQKTNGKGVDIVLNSLAEEKLQASIRCLKEGGRFLEIGKFDLSVNNRLSLKSFLRQISYHGVMLDELMRASDNQKTVLKDLMNRGLKSGAIKPLSRKVFVKDELEAAIRFMAAGKHMGKVILKMRDENELPNTPMLAAPRYYCFEDRSYIIMGGLGGFGLELDFEVEMLKNIVPTCCRRWFSALIEIVHPSEARANIYQGKKTPPTAADWMVLRGAKNLVITSRNGIKCGYQKMRIDLWKSYGTDVVIVSGKDASKIEDCEFIVQKAAKMAPIDGIFNLAVALKDGTWNNQTPETFKESFQAKAWATKNLDEISRKLCPDLRHFVVFSSVSCGRGNAEQTNYGMSNSVMERICEKRAAEGFPGLAIQWGAIGDVGLVADMQDDNRELVIGGTLQQSILSCLQKLDEFLCQSYPIVSSMVVAEKRAGGAGATNAVDTVLNILGLKDIKSVSPQMPLAELGMDSMMAVEIKQVLEREYEVFLTPQDIRNLNFAKLQDMANKSEQTNIKQSSNENTTEELSGMKLLIRVVGFEDEDPKPCIPMKTMHESDETEIFFIPGIEGIGKVFETLAPKINSSAYCLQFGINISTQDSIDVLASILIPHVYERIVKAKSCNFTLVGYSFGSLVAIELVRKLESEGMTGKLILIDGSPLLMKEIKLQHLKSNSDEELQTNILIGMINTLQPTIGLQLFPAIEKLSSWDDKLQTFLLAASKIPELSAYRLENQAAFCTAIYKRLQAVENYTAVSPIKTPITLLKPTQPTARSVAEDYDLSKLTEGKVSIHYIEGNHVTILDNSQIATFINDEPMEDT